jgi:vacuolar-type H+-ATPase subunit E/Vma4
MSLDRILQALQAETESQIAEAEQAAQAEITRIQAEAHAKAVAAEQQHLPAIQASLQAERARILNQAKLEALQVVLGTREAIIGSALDAAAGRLAALPGSETYAQLMRQLARECVAVLSPDGPLCLRVQRRDVPLMERIVREMDLPATLASKEESESLILGGLIATTSDGRITMDNTLVVRLQRAASLYRSQIAGMLFDRSREG